MPIFNATKTNISIVFVYMAVISDFYDMEQEPCIGIVMDIGIGIYKNQSNSIPLPT